ncbi:MAG: FAD-dependent oxidoreductase [Gammaproteobacteria bacterium]|jgi:ferredoxin-NADP reductase|nr:FAD-dependent oxidoreductase [Gammaproteobacteria bacterium]
MSYIKARISDIRTLTPSVKLFEIDFGSQAFAYVPGQWVNLELQAGSADQSATFSITSTPNGKNAIEIAVKRVEHLPTSLFLHEQLKIGDDINISQAQGNTVLPDNISQNQPMVFIAGGTGVTPFVSMLRQIYSIDRHFQATLLYSVTSADECLFYDELYEMEKAYESFQFLLTTTREAAHHADYFGRINSEMLKLTGLDHKAQYFVCGPPQMVDDIADLLADLGVVESHIHYDKWW